MINKLFINIQKKQNVCISYTDRLDSYFHIHCKDDNLTEGLWCENQHLIKNLCFYDKKHNKKVFPSDFDKIIYRPHQVECFYKNAKVTIALLLRDYEKSTNFPVLKVNFSQSSNEVSLGFILDNVENIKFFNIHNELLKNNVIKKKKIVLVEMEKPGEDFEFFCCFENVTNLSELKKNHISKIKDFFQKINLEGLGELTESTLWALFSGWLLVTGKKHRGIWAGLPWFRDNWGRDTFIALPGILLVSGQFEEAKSVISSFAQFQDKNPKSKTFGRIPNRYIDENNMIYNTADGTLWFVREVWEYLNYTGDYKFLDSMWEVIKLALEYDIKSRTDDFGFLCHGDADTWMDARIKGQEALSPRSSRANDIQILWYVALKIAEKMAEIKKEEDYKQLFEQKAILVKENFIKFFISKSKENEKTILGDCLQDKNHLDKAIRPNTFFAFSVPKVLHQIDNDLFTYQDKYEIIKNTFEELAFEYGFLSLSQNHEDFHPFHDKCKKYHKDAAYHNGTIWVWNSGPAIDSLAEVYQQNVAYKISCFHSKQLLDSKADETFGSRCLGSLSENINAYKKNKIIYPSGTWSQAWSVSEFARNVFQSYLGFMPNLIEQKLSFVPCFPSAWKVGKVKFPFGNNFCEMSWEKVGKKETTFLKDKKFDIDLYQFKFALENKMDLTLEVKAVFDDNLSLKSLKFDDKGEISFEAGVILNSEEFIFAKEKDFSIHKKPKSICKKNYLFKKTLAKKGSMFFTPVK